MKVMIDCSVEEARLLFGDKLPDIQIKLFDDRSYYSVEHRLKLIKDNMPFEEVRSEFLFRRLRRVGYSPGRKTFMRDIALLEDEGFITKKVFMGGPVGTTSFIKRV